MSQRDDVRGRILIVDDSPATRQMACSYLAEAGYRVHEVDTGEAALAYLAEQPVDLILLDILMAGIDGFETCRAIRADPRVQEIPILFLTALGDVETTEPALAAGGDDLIAKPFTRADLLLRVQSLLRLKQQARRLERQNEQLRQLSQMIVHDLRGPAMALQMNLEFLREAALGGEYAEALEDMATSLVQLNRTVNDLLDVSRAEDVGMTVRPSPFDLAIVVQEVATALRGAGRARNVEVTTQIHARMIVADRELLRRLLQNLVQNAIRHSPSRGEVTIEASRESRGLLVRVLDQGPGIAAEDTTRIFERYVSQVGSGLGLAFCRMVAEAHGGRIWVEPRTPTGAVFCAWFPQLAPA